MQKSLLDSALDLDSDRSVLTLLESEAEEHKVLILEEINEDGNIVASLWKFVKPNDFLADLGSHSQVAETFLNKNDFVNKSVIHKCIINPKNTQDIIKLVKLTNTPCSRSWCLPQNNVVTIKEKFRTTQKPTAQEWLEDILSSVSIACPQQRDPSFSRSCRIS